MEFELKRKDFGARIGKLKIGGHEIETPTIMPVVNPNIQTLDSDELKKIGAEIIITNSYIIYKNEELRKRALNDGIHELIGFDGPIMTDSGAYQLSVYGDIDVSPKEIIKFQKKIGSDIIVPLDIPTAPDVSQRKAKQDLEKTMDRLKEIENEAKNLAGIVQGSVFSELRKDSAKKVSTMKFDYYCIGGVVPLMEKYDFKALANIIVSSKKNLPENSPVHLFGAGHPMTFALATTLGCDLFDSAAYALFAKRNKYLTNRGTLDINDLKYLPCNCPVCEKHNPTFLKENKDYLAKHNLYSTFEEIKTIKEAIRNGESFELASERSRSHPDLLSGFKSALKEVKSYYEKITPETKKSAFFYLGEESSNRPEIKRNYEKLKRLEFDAEKLLIVPQDFEINEKENIQVMKIKPPFIYPKELERTYPFGQSLIADINVSKRNEEVKEILEKFIKEKGDLFEEIYSFKLNIKLKEVNEIKKEDTIKNFAKKGF